MTAVKPIAGPETYSEEWHALRVFDPARERPVVFGASEAQMAIENPLQLFNYKTGRQSRPEATEDMEVGLLMEPVVLEMYHRRSGHDIVVNVPMFFHGAHDFMAASVDAVGRKEPDNEAYRQWIASGQIDPRFWGVDAKTSHDRMFLKDALAEDGGRYGQEGTDLVPTYVLWQMQQQCSVMNFPHVDVPVLFGRKYRLYRVARDEQLIAALVAAEKELAERIIADDPPEPNWSHPSTRECIRAMYGFEPGLATILSEEALELWNSMTRWKEEIKGREEHLEAGRNRILFEMKGAQTGVFPSGAKGIRRTVVKDSIVTQADVDALQAKVGQVKRKAFEQLRETKL
jgi:predicted phage-related endonuclease